MLASTAVVTQNVELTRQITPSVNVTLPVLFITIQFVDPMAKHMAMLVVYVALPVHNKVQA